MLPNRMRPPSTGLPHVFSLEVTSSARQAVARKDPVKTASKNVTTTLAIISNILFVHSKFIFSIIMKLHIAFDPLPVLFIANIITAPCH